MVAMTLVLRVLRLTAGDDDGTDFVRNLDLRHCSVQECVFDFHNVSFPLETALSGRNTKRAGGHDGQHRQTEPTRRHGKARWVHRVQKNLGGVFGSLCIPPPLMRISRL